MMFTMKVAVYGESSGGDMLSYMGMMERGIQLLNLAPRLYHLVKNLPPLPITSVSYDPYLRDSVNQHFFMPPHLVW